jgi:hypothetical protein
LPFQNKNFDRLIDEYECLGGISKLGNKLKSLKSQVLKEGIDKVSLMR